MSAGSGLRRDARVAVLRFGALGDVVMAGAAVAALRRQRPDVRIAVLTKAAYAPLLAAIDDVEVWPLSTERGALDLARLAARLAGWRPDVIYDLHGTLRARALRALVRRPQWRQVDKQVLTRWLRLRHVPLRPSRHLVERFGDVLQIAVPQQPWLHPKDVLADARRLALVPGAAWATKRWPTPHWLELARHWQERGGTVEWLGGDAERDVLTQLRGVVGGTVVVAQPLLAVAARLAGAAAVVAGDTGLGHLAAAVGTPVVALFGPTVPAYGYTPWGRHRVAQVDLGCRPCTLHGGDACPLAHHACMATLTPTHVAAVLDELRATRTDARRERL